VNHFAEIDLMRIIAVLKKKLWLLLLVSLLFSGASFAYTQFFVTPLYRVSVSLFVDNASGEGAPGRTPAEINAARQLVDTYIVMASSNTVLSQVAIELDNAYSADDIRYMMTTTTIRNTEIFGIEITHTSPDEAALIANTLADVAGDVIAGFIEGSSLRVVDFAQLPDAPFSPNLLQNVLLGFLIGLFLTAGIVIFLDVQKDNIKAADKTETLYGMPILGVIPNLEDKKIRKLRRK